MATHPSNFVEYGPMFRLANGVSAGLSVAGSTAVIASFVVFPQLRRYFSRLVIYLAVSDLWLCTSFLIGEADPPHNTKCRVQSCLGIFFGLSSILWTAAIADSLKRVLIDHDLSVESRYESRLHIVSWGTPATMLLACLGCGLIGPAGSICWIKNTAAGHVARVVSFYLPLWFVIAYCLWVYWSIRSLMLRLLEQRKIHATADESELTSLEFHVNIEKQQQSTGYLLLMPLVLIICWTPSSVRWIIEIFVPDLGWVFLDYLSAICGPLQGLLNAIIYGATPAVRDAALGRLHHSAQMMRAAQSRIKRTQRKSQRRFKRFHDEPGGLAPFQLGTPRLDPEDLGPATIGRSAASGTSADTHSGRSGDFTNGDRADSAAASVPI